MENLEPETFYRFPILESFPFLFLLDWLRPHFKQELSNILQMCPIYLEKIIQYDLLLNKQSVLV